MRLFIPFITLLAASALFSADVKHYYPDKHNEKRGVSNSSSHNLMWAYYQPGEAAFKEFMNRSTLSKGQVQEALRHPMQDPKDALIFALYHDYKDYNASDEVFAAYEYAAYNRGNAGNRRGYLAFADFLIRTKNYTYVINNLDPEMCYQFANQCAYYRVAASYLRDGFCEEEWYKTATKFSHKVPLLISKCRGKIRMRSAMPDGGILPSDKTIEKDGYTSY